ncbi:hypothetical protein PF008_g30514 [Phytophthora fragariae]|uniref:Uncharacterized protein n=1 Tax=Phytophthora fragariae TaxID=53985 RepID=A0A6G0Q5U5_9STRA|nr:hypothetical protein PF008_g30514 [Phytophthora fragariae]
MNCFVYAVIQLPIEAVTIFFGREQSLFSASQPAVEFIELCRLSVGHKPQILEPSSTSPVGRLLEVIDHGAKTSDFIFLSPTVSFQILELGVQAVDDIVQAISIPKQGSPGRLSAAELLLQTSDLAGRRTRGPSRATRGGRSNRTR